LKYFTEIEIKDLEETIKDEKNINNLKILLANEATKILHGEKNSKEAEKTAKETFEGSGIGKNLPEILLKKKQITNGMQILDLLVNDKIFKSKSEARRAINEKGIKINDQVVVDEKKIISSSDFNDDILKISHGKKRHFLVKIY
jgi:tyrosyl-tRNA synthetase